MKITEYGKIVRKARIDADLTMLDMAEDLGVSSAYLSALEVGRKRIPGDFLGKVIDYLKKKVPTLDSDRLRDAVAISNNSIPVEGLSVDHQFLVAGFARTNMSQADIDDFRNLLAKVRSKNEQKDV